MIWTVFTLTIFVSCLLSIVMTATGRLLIGKCALITAFVLSTSSIVAIGCVAGRFPSYGAYESISIVVMVMLFLLVIDVFKTNVINNTKHIIISLAVVMVLLSLLFMPGVKSGLNYDFFMYGEIWVVGFFFVRTLAVGLFIYGGLFYLQAWLERDESTQSSLLWYGHRYLLLGAGFFLLAELSGSIWAMLWLADGWRWSGGFLHSMVMFLLVMIPYHIPFDGKLKIRFQCLSGVGVPLAIAYLTLFSQLWGGH